MASRTLASDDRLAAARAQAIRRAGERLLPKLISANTATYLRAMRAQARVLGATPPKAITDPAVTAAVAARAAVSAQSIAQTSADRMRALVAQTGSRADAQPLYDEWAKGQQERVAAYEAAMTVDAAHTDLHTRNADKLTGSEHVGGGSAQCVPCGDALAQGEQPLGTFSTFPLHVGCSHYPVRTYDQPDDPASLWVGEEEDA